ncbi:hypothetical protein SAMN04487949_1888 [Halogranum gelatinilyticum]|uniref:Uncharacterized protein n=1 Tax=Halogranum gelatinilyticum TaxID=660521 RepID=A0A1G9TS26_9EURY|nr:hypothetical protein [Halogranum gelatinilyticum]SDM50520.1 hypothetical protein SAMN04487949_1888 [Halogranum gelatinilyticum]
MSEDPTPTEELTEKRTKLLKVIAADLPNTEFARSQLNAHLYYNDVSEHIDEDDDEEEDTLQTTTSLLNKIVEEDGYLKKTQQGGETSFILDDEADEDKGEKVTAVTPSEIRTIVSQVCNRHGVSVSFTDDEIVRWSLVTRRVNAAVGHRVLRIASMPNEYRLREAGYEIIADELL